MGTVRSINWTKDGAHLLTSSDDKSLKLWDFAKKHAITSLMGHNNWVRASTFSPDERIIASGSDDKSVKLWDVRSFKAVHTFTDHVEYVVVSLLTK
jgi:centriolar protein POC1